MANLEDLRRARASGAQCLIVMSQLPSAAAQESKVESSDDSEEEELDESAELRPVGSSNRRWQLSSMSPIVTSGGQQTVSILRALKFGWTERTRLPPLVDLGDESSSSWFEPELAARRIA